MPPRYFILLEVAVNLLLPWLAYTLSVSHLGEFGALLVSSIPPLFWSFIELARHRHVDALSALVLGGLLLSLVAMTLGGDARLLLVRESMLSGLIGVVFLGSLLVRRPLLQIVMRAILRRQGDAASPAFARWSQRPAARHAFGVLTLVWGIGLTAEAAFRTLFALNADPRLVLAVAPVVSYLVAGALAFWTFRYIRALDLDAVDDIEPAQQQSPVLPAETP